MPHLVPRLGFALTLAASLGAAAPSLAAGVAVEPIKDFINFGSRDLGGIAEATSFVCFEAIGSPPIPCGALGTISLTEALAPPFYLAGVFRVSATGAISPGVLPLTLEPGEAARFDVQWVADQAGLASDVLKLTIDGSDSGIEPFEIEVRGTGTVSGICPSTGALCLGAGERFKVEGRFLTNSALSGVASTIELTQDTGFLWFFSPSNVEAVIKVLDGCLPSNHYWVFAGGLTNVRTLFTVTDLQAGLVKTYINPQNLPFQPIQDTSAFETCP